MSTVPISPANPNSYLGFALQSAKGTGLAPVYFAAYVDSVDLSHGPQNRPVREAGTSLHPARAVVDTYLPGARIAAPLRPNLGAAIAAYYCGGAAIAGAGDPFTHTITLDTLTRWVSFEQDQADDLIERLVDGFFLELEIDIRKRDQGPEAMVIGTIGALSMVRQAAATVESYETDRPFLRSDCVWTLDGAAETNVESATIRLRWTFDEAMLADAVTRVDAAKVRHEGEITVVQLYGVNDGTENTKTAYIDTHYDGTGGTGTTLDEIAGLVGDFTVDMNYTAAANRQFKLDAPVVRWTEAELTPLNPNATEVARLTRTGQIEANPGAEDLTITAQNARSTDYIP